MVWEIHLSKFINTRTVWQFLKKLNTESPYDPAIPLLGIYPREMKTYIYTKTCKQIFTAALLRIAKSGNNPNAYKLIDKENVA